MSDYNYIKNGIIICIMYPNITLPCPRSLILHYFTFPYLTLLYFSLPWFTLPRDLSKVYIHISCLVA